MFQPLNRRQFARLSRQRRAAARRARALPPADSLLFELLRPVGDETDARMVVLRTFGKAEQV